MNRISSILVVLLTICLLSACSSGVSGNHQTATTPASLATTPVVGADNDVIDVISLSISHNPRSAKELIRNSDLILIGTLEGIYKEYPQSKGIAFTEFNVTIRKTLKGEYAEPIIRVYQSGIKSMVDKALLQEGDKSKLSNEAVEFDTLHLLPMGTEVLLFLKGGEHPETDAGVSWVPYGLYAGTYVVGEDGKVRSSIREKARSELMGKDTVMFEMENDASTVASVEKLISETK